MIYNEPQRSFALFSLLLVVAGRGELFGWIAGAVWALIPAVVNFTRRLK